MTYSKYVKITKPENLKEYFQQTEYAVRYLFKGIDTCRSYYKRARKHWDISKINQPRTPENMAELKKYLELAGKYYSLQFSEGILAGSILQVAATGIRYFSHNTIIPASCKSIVTEKDKGAIPFCIGKELFGLPIGLIIYAARNQYSHWDNVSLRNINTGVFEILDSFFQDNMHLDLAFSLDNPSILIYANLMLLIALDWTTYKKYVTEMEILLPET